MYIRGSLFCAGILFLYIHGIVFSRFQLYRNLITITAD